MKQLTSDPTTLFQHKLIKWLYMVSLVVNGTIGLGQEALPLPSFFKVIISNGQFLCK